MGINAVAFWRDTIAADFKQKAGAKSRRIADQARIEISQLPIEPAPNARGHGVAFVNGFYPASQDTRFPKQISALPFLCSRLEKRRAFSDFQRRLPR